MNRTFKVMMLTLACLLMASTGFAQWQTFTVDANAAPGGTTYPTLTEAIATATAYPGGPHVIEIKAGTYYEYNEGSSPVANPLDYYTLDLMAWDSHQIIKEIKAIEDGVIFECPADKWQTVDFLAMFRCGIAAYGGTFVDINSNGDFPITIRGYDVGIYGGEPQNVTYANLVFEECNQAIKMRETIHTNIYDVTIDNCGAGILIEDSGTGPSNDVTVGPNVAVSNGAGYGVYIHNSINSTVDGCTVSDMVGDGIMVMTPNFGDWGTRNFGNTVSNNTIFNCGANGIKMTFQASGNIIGNTVYDCATNNTLLETYGGIAVAGNGVITGNTVYNNGDHAGFADYGIAIDDLILAGFGNIDVGGNCIFGHVGVQALDGIDLAGASGANYWHGNYYGDQTASGTYALDGTGGSTDWSVAAFDASAVGPATVEVLGPYSVDVEWTIPGCSELDGQELAAYEFTVSYDETKLAYVGSSYNPNALDADGFFGFTDDGALYTGIVVNEVAGEISFAATNFDNPHIGDGIMASLQFEAIALGASQITIGSTYRDGDDPPNDLLGANTPLDVLVVDTEAPSFVTFDVEDVLTFNTFGNLNDMVISGTVHDNFNLAQVFCNTGYGPGWQSVGTVTGMDDSFGPFTVNLAGCPDGTNNLQMKVRDGANPYNDFDFGYAFEVDNTGPDVANLTLTDPDGCADAGFSSNDLVNVAWDNLDGSAVKHEFYSSDAPVWAGAVPIANPTTYTFDGTEGSHSLWVRQYDVYGNMGGQAGPIAIMVDKTAPAPSAAWLVSDPTPATTTTDMVDGDANLDAASGALYAKATEDGVDLGCADAGWALISGLGSPPRFSFDLSDAQGLKTVTFASKDAAGNVGTTDATITLDDIATEIDAISVADADDTECADNWAVEVTVSWTGTDVAWLHLGNDPGVYGAPIDISAEVSPFTTTYSFVSPRVNMAVNTVVAVIEDGAGNTGTEMSAGIFVDRTNPTAGTVLLNGAVNTWTANPVVTVDLSGMSLDANEILMSEVMGDYTAAVSEVFDPGTPSTTYDFGTPVENAWVYLYVKLEDCADRQSAEVKAGGVAFDFTAPILSAVVINGGAASTNNATVSVNFTWTELHMTTVYISENSDMSGAVSYPWAGGPPYAFVVPSGDGMKEVYVQLEDHVGNMSTIEMDDIDLDNTLPLAGTLTVYSPNPMAIDNHTAVLTGNTYLYVPDDDDIVQVIIRNADGNPTLGWMAYVDPMAGTLMDLDDPTVCDDITVEWYVKDDAGNQSGPFNMMVDYCNVAPPPPPTATGTPGGSVLLEWAAVPGAQKYHIRYNFSSEYPTYPSGPPPFPTTMGQGIFEAEVMTNSYDFEGPQDDLFAFGLWTLSDQGVYSLTGNNTVLEHNYRLGDFMDPEEVLGSDGCLSYDPEFVFFGAAYNTSPASNPNLDIGPTDDGSSTGVAQPDDAINFEDLTIFAINYQWSRAQVACDGQKSGGGAAASLADVTVSAEAPAYARIGDEFSVPILISEGAGVAGYHLVFDFDVTVLEVVSVDPGSVYQGIDKSFFYHDADASGIDISSVVLNDGGLDAGEIAVVTFRSRITGPVTLKDELLDVRDWDNQKANVSFNLAAKGGSLPDAFSLSQNYPNPFNPATTIELSLPEATSYRLTIYNVIGQVINEFEGYGEAGYVTINWDASQQSSGVYLYRVTAGDFSDTKKMILLK